jgi:small-conductance mechanosensitive channel
MDNTNPGLWEWRFEPYRVLPVRTLLLALVIMAVGLVLVSNFGMSMLAFLLLIVFTWSLRLAIFATGYRVDREGIHRQNLGRTQHFSSEMIRRIVPTPGSVFISQHSRASRLDRFQGWLIPLPKQHKEQIINHLQALSQNNRGEEV